MGFLANFWLGYEAMMRKTVVFLLLLNVAPMLCEANARFEPAGVKSLSFDVVLVRPGSRESPPQVWDSASDNPFKIRNMSLAEILSYVFDVRSSDLIAGIPKWANSEVYDIDAKVSPEDFEAVRGLKATERRALLQPVLADRFGLKFHTEWKSIKALELITMRGGAKMKEVPAPENSGQEGRLYGNGPAGLRGERISIARLTKSLTAITGRPIVDHTGLTGFYDFRIKWDPSTSANNPSSDSGSIPRDGVSLEASIFTAIQEQLGLRLHPCRTLMPVLVVDHVERPSGN